MRVIKKITFKAKDEAESLRVAKEKLGREAVVLSAIPIKDGGFLGFNKKDMLLVSAGLLDEEQKEDKKNTKDSRETIATFQKLMDLRHASEMNTQLTTPIVTPVQNITQINPSNYANPAPSIRKDTYQPSDRAPARAPTVDTDNRQNKNSTFLNLKEEVNSLSEKLSNIVKQLNEQSSSPESKEHPEFADEACENIYKTLTNSEMSLGYAKKIINEYIDSKREGTFSSWLAKRVNVASTDPILAVGGKRIAFIGPTGVGKTTTIAKIATIFTLWEHKVLLLTSDTFRIAAFDQLKTYAKILGIPAEVINDPDRINEIIGNHSDSDIILLDTAGRNQKEARHTEYFSSLFSLYKPDAIHLVLAANMKHKDMLDVIDKVSPLNISHLLITKLDETTSYGPIFEIGDKLGKPFSFFTAGQNVPTDIEVASGDFLCKLIFGAKDIGMDNG